MTQKTWFNARRYGWGWGLPSTWQGWLVYGAFLLLALAGTRVFPVQHHAIALLVWELGITGLLVAICSVTGERPRWRWGGR